MKPYLYVSSGDPKPKYRNIPEFLHIYSYVQLSLPETVKQYMRLPKSHLRQFIVEKYLSQNPPKKKDFQYI
jgi:hypothetical protein